MSVAQRIEHKIADLEVGGSIPLGHAREGSHSGQLHEFRKLERAISTQVRILYPPQKRRIIMKIQISAGGIVYKKENNGTQILVSQHSMHHGWVFPKGLIGDREEIKDQTEEETALREVKEETGAIGEIENKLTPVTYFFYMDGEKIQKTVHYFVMKFIGGDITKHDHEMEHVEWIDYNNVSEKLTYDSDKKVWEEAKNLI